MELHTNKTLPDQTRDNTHMDKTSILILAAKRIHKDILFLSYMFHALGNLVTSPVHHVKHGNETLIPKFHQQNGNRPSCTHTKAPLMCQLKNVYIKSLHDGI